MINKEISFICPTHNRGKLQARLAKSIFEKASNPDQVEIVFGIDEGDENALLTCKTLKEEYGEDSIQIVLVPPGEKLSSIGNQCAGNTRGEIIGLIADDVEIMSEKWDDVVKEEFSKYDDGILLLWSDDGIWGGQLASHYFIHRNWIKALGRSQPTFFYADWTDHWNQKLATLVGRTKCIRDRDRLFLHHKHAEFGGMDKDDTYWKVKDKRERNVKEGLSFHKPTKEMVEEFNQDYEKLKYFIATYRG